MFPDQTEPDSLLNVNKRHLQACLSTRVGLMTKLAQDRDFRLMLEGLGSAEWMPHRPL
jgi:hypothetical protein